MVTFVSLCFRVSGSWYYLLSYDTVWCGRSHKCIVFYSSDIICKGILTTFFWSTAVRGPAFVQN